MHEPDLPGSARLFESSGQLGDVVNPFASIPFPNMIRVGLNDDEYPRDDRDSCWMEIRDNGTAAVILANHFEDPIVAVTFSPQDFALFEFLSAHFSHYKAEWEALPIDNRRDYMNCSPQNIESKVERAEQKKETKPAWWWAGMHSDALHPGDRKTCEHCQQMIVAFGKMPPKGEIIKAYKDNLGPNGTGAIRECVLTPPTNEEQPEIIGGHLGKPGQPKLSKEFLDR